MTLDLSTAPEIALLAGPLGAEPTQRGCGTRVSVGYLAGCLGVLAAEPQHWWELVRFDPAAVLRIPVAAPRPGCAAWLLVVPPGEGAAGGEGTAGEGTAGWEAACLIAGEMAEWASTPDGPVTRPLRAGRTRVRGERSHGGREGLVNTGTGYAIVLAACPA
ncbi:MAG TPA: cysteine dioxygenase [Streptosporangiaceae bacterium]|jgi:hypothetical protein